MGPGILHALIETGPLRGRLDPARIETADKITISLDIVVFEDGLVIGRNISPVDQEFIMSHYRALGGPKPPPIHHQGIDDAFLEKASVTHYWYEGKWLRLQGAD